MRIAFLGFGLIGGSIARGLRERGSDGDGMELVAWSPSGEGPAAAVRDRVVDAAAPTALAALDGAHLVVLAGPAPTVLEELDALAGPWRSALAPDVVITDVASTKSAIVARAAELGLRFAYGGLARERIEVVPELGRALDRGLELTPAGGELVLLPTYTAMLALRRIVAERGHVRNYWERAA